MIGESNVGEERQCGQCGCMCHCYSPECSCGCSKCECDNYKSQEEIDTEYQKKIDDI